MSSIHLVASVPSPRTPPKLARVQLDTAPATPSPLRNCVLVDDQDESHSTTDRRDSLIDDCEKSETTMVPKDLFDFLMVDDANDHLAKLPQASEHRLKVHPHKPHEYDGYPMLVQSDVDEAYTRKDLIHDPDKHAPWAPFQDGDSKLTMAHVHHKTRYERERRMQLHSDKVEAPEERSWTRAVMLNRLKPEFAKRMETWNKRQRRADRKEQSDVGSPMNAAVEVFLEMSSSAELFALLTMTPQNSPPSTPQELPTPPSSSELSTGSPGASPTSSEASSPESKSKDTWKDFGAAIALMKLSEEPSLMPPTDLDMSGLGTEIDTSAEKERLEQIQHWERAVMRRRVRAIPPSPPSSSPEPLPPRREPDHSPRLEPLRRIARCEAHTLRPVAGKPDHRPEWAKRGGPPSDELKASQRKINAFAVKLWESCQRDHPEMSSNSCRTVEDKTKAHEDLMKPLWRRRNAGAELKRNDQGISCGDDSLLTFWKTNESRAGSEDGFVSPNAREREKDATKKQTAFNRWEAYTSRWGVHDESEDEDMSQALAAEEYEFFTEEHNQLDEIFDEPDGPIGAFNPAEVDHYIERERQQRKRTFRAAGATNEQLEEWHQEVYSRSCAQMDEGAKEARQALEATRQLVPKAQPKSPSTSPTKKRKRDSDDETEPPAKRSPRQRRPTEKAAQNSASAGPKRLMVTLKFTGEALQSFRSHGLATDIEDGSVVRRIMEGVVEKVAMKLIQDGVNAVDGS